MKTPSVILRWSALLALAFGSVSCVTTYDAAGRPVQTVDPVVATAGVAAGLIGYAIGQDNSRGSHYHHGGGYGYYGGHGHYAPHCYY